MGGFFNGILRCACGSCFGYVQMWVSRMRGGRCGLGFLVGPFGEFCGIGTEVIYPYQVVLFSWLKLPPFSLIGVYPD